MNSSFAVTTLQSKIVKNTIGIIILATGFFIHIPSDANLLVNGSFEEGNWIGTDGSYRSLTAGNTNLTGWTISGGGVDWHNATEFSPIVDGNKAVDLNTAGILSQSFSTTVNEWYSLNFSLAAPYHSTPNDFSPRTVSVNIVGSNYLSAIVPPSYQLNLTWYELSDSLRFQATSTTTTLTISATGGNGFWGMLIDNVVVVNDALNVPEPTTLALLGIGIAGLGAARRRKAV